MYCFATTHWLFEGIRFVLIATKATYNDWLDYITVMLG